MCLSRLRGDEVFHLKQKDIAEMTDNQLFMYFEYMQTEYRKGYSAFRVRLSSGLENGGRPILDMPDEFNVEVKKLAKTYMEKSIEMITDEVNRRGLM